MSAVQNCLSSLLFNPFFDVSCNGRQEHGISYSRPFHVGIFSRLGSSNGLKTARRRITVSSLTSRTWWSWNSRLPSRARWTSLSITTFSPIAWLSLFPLKKEKDLCETKLFCVRTEMYANYIP